jgi:MoaA/NifB/PqqE/SkfB family radical SAM enzyme
MSQLKKALKVPGKMCKGIYAQQRINNGFLTPKYLWFEVTDLCNSRCEYCNIYKKPPTKNPLTPKETKRILSSPLFQNVQYIIHSGGEPTVRSDLLEILLAQHEALPTATIQLSTNGLLPERAIAAVSELQRRNIPVEVGISLDGVGEAHDSIRGVKGNFQKVDYLVKELLKMKAAVSLGSTLTNKNLENNLKAKEYSQSLNVPFMWHWFNQSGFYGNEQSDRAQNYKKTEEMIHAVKTTTPPGLYRDMWINELNGVKPKFKCFALNTFAVLKCNGDIAPCLSMWNNTIGTVRDEDPAKVWSSKQAKQVRKSIKNCEGCLNSWGACWSLSTSYYPNLFHKIKENIQPRKNKRRID